MTLREMKEKIDELIEAGYGTYECVGNNSYGYTECIFELSTGIWHPLPNSASMNIISFDTEGWTGG